MKGSMFSYYFLSIFLLLVSVESGGLKPGYYSSSCPKAEVIVRSTVQSHFNKNPTIAPALLRLHFHDCFVEGCDGSVLIAGPSAERNALPNQGLRGFEVIDNAKTQLEALCPGVVSCADILALAARDAVNLSGGPSWPVPTGRRDGRISSSSQAFSTMYITRVSVAEMRQKFAAKGLNDQDLVTLLGAHTIGQTSCSVIRYRLYNFTSTGTVDPTINKSFLPQLRGLCPSQGNSSKRVALDVKSQTKFDINFYKNVRDGKAVLESDQLLWEDSVTRKIVNNYAGTRRGSLGLIFDREFSKSMIKMGRIQVKTGTQGEVRKVCSRFN